MSILHKAPKVIIDDPHGVMDHDAVIRAAQGTGSTLPILIRTKRLRGGTYGRTQMQPKGCWLVEVDPRCKPGFDYGNFDFVLWHELGHIYDLTERLKRSLGGVSFVSYTLMSMGLNARFSYSQMPTEAAANRYAAEHANQPLHAADSPTLGHKGRDELSLYE